MQKLETFLVAIVTALPVSFVQQLALGGKRELFVTFSLWTLERGSVIYAVGYAGFPLKLEDGLLMLQFMECLSTHFSLQMAPGRELHSYRRPCSSAVICWSWILTWAEHCCHSLGMRITKTLQTAFWKLSYCHLFRSLSRLFITKFYILHISQNAGELNRKTSNSLGLTEPSMRNVGVFFSSEETQKYGKARKPLGVQHPLRAQRGK